jgi:glycerol-3-phosphate dehydrogenase (NAD(P)+)
MPLERVAVVGAGGWGTALAQAALAAGREVQLVGRDPEVIAEINTRHRNARYLGELPLGPELRAVPALEGPVDVVIMAVPAQATRTALAALPPAMLDGLPVLLSAKGLEAGTLRRQSEILAETIPGALPFVLSGPSFAVDVAAGRPTAVTLAGDDAAATEALAAALAGPGLRPYAAGDRLGVELAGALKNVYAVACGAVDGAGLGASARSALLARGFAEMGRIITGLGGAATTLTGLAGLGDLALSCTSTQSRNYRFGVALGQGESADVITARGSGLAEGVATAPVAQALARRLNVDVPLIDAVNRLLAGDSSITAIVSALMSRPLKRED